MLTAGWGRIWHQLEYACASQAKLAVVAPFPPGATSHLLHPRGTFRHTQPCDSSWPPPASHPWQQPHSTAALPVPSHYFHSELGKAHRDLSHPCHPLHVGSTINRKDCCFEINCRGNRMSASQQGLRHMQPSPGRTAATGREKGASGRILGSKNFRPLWRI